MHRSGRFQKGRVRPIIAKFHHYLDRELVWEKRKSLPVTSRLYIRAVYPEEIGRRRRVLQAVADVAVQNPKYKGKVYLSKDKLVIDGDRFSIGEIGGIPDDLKVATGCKSDSETTSFYGIQSPFSNFYPANFELEGMFFNCVEQAFCYNKCLHYNQPSKAMEIMSETNPAIQKFIGKSVSKDSDEWNDLDISSHVMLAALNAKFSQSSYLRTVLLSTGTRVLSEANTYDKVWGSGVGFNDKDVLHHSTWTGKNRLGKLLMKIRDQQMVSIN